MMLPYVETTGLRCARSMRCTTSSNDAAAHFGAMGRFASMSNPASSALTRQRLGWVPGTHPGLIDDVDHSTADAA